MDSYYSIVREIAPIKKEQKMKSKRFTTLIAIFIMSLLACVALIGTTVVSAEETTPDASAEVAKYFETTDGVTFGIDGQDIVFNVTKDATVTSKYDFNLEATKVAEIAGVTTNTGAGKGYGKLEITFDVADDATEATVFKIKPEVYVKSIEKTFRLYDIEEGVIKAYLNGTTYTKPFADEVIYGYKYEDVTVNAYHGFVEKFEEKIKIYTTTDFVNLSNHSTTFKENIDKAFTSGEDYKFTSKGDNNKCYKVMYGFVKDDKVCNEFQTVTVVENFDDVKAPEYDKEKLHEFVTSDAYTNYVESFDDQLKKTEGSEEKWVSVGSSTPFEFEKDNELYNYFVSEVFVNADLEPVIYYKLPESDSFTKLSSSSSTKKFYLTKVGYYEFYVLATDPLNNSLEIDEDWRLTTLDITEGEVTRAIKGYYNDANELQVPVFTFYLGNSGPQITNSGSSNSTAAGFVNVKYTKLSTFTVLGVDTTTTYKLYYNANANAAGPENGGDWKEISDEEVFNTVFADKEYSDLGWSSSTLDFVPVAKGAYVVKCEVVDGAANSVEAFSGIVKVEGGITKAEIARVQVWFENNWKSLIFLGIALLSLIGIIVLLFVKPKEEKEIEENTTAR